MATDEPADDLMTRNPWDSCTYCHGIDGAIHDPTVPAIAGQSAAYLRKQLADFRAGERIDPSGMMTSALFLLEPSDDEAVVRYFSSKPRPQTESVIATSPSLIGEKLFERGTTDRPACLSCHGDQARTANTSYPDLHGLSAGYVATQLRRFRTGDRANDANQVMRTLARQMSDEEIDAVAKHIGRR
jgi:cytochrome c553